MKVLVSVLVNDINPGTKGQHLCKVQIQRFKTKLIGIVGLEKHVPSLCLLPDWLRVCVTQCLWESARACVNLPFPLYLGTGVCAKEDAKRNTRPWVCALTSTPLARGHLESIREIIYGHGEVTTQKCCFQKNMSQLLELKDLRMAFLCRNQRGY